MARDTKKRVMLASRHPAALLLPASAFCRVVGLSVRLARQAQSVAEETARRQGTWRRVEALRERDRLLTAVREAETKYPGILLHCVRTRRYGNVVREYGIPITKQRVGQIAKALRALARNLGYADGVVAAAAKHGKLPQTTRERLGV